MVAPEGICRYRNRRCYLDIRLDDLVASRLAKPLGAQPIASVTHLGGRQHGRDHESVPRCRSCGPRGTIRRSRGFVTLVSRKISVITDSNSMLPGAVAQEYGITVIPLPVMIDDESYLEGVDLDPDDFYRRLGEGATITTSQPSPGVIAETYRRAVDDGAEAIVSVHVAKHMSGTINSARIAARDLDIVVELVDTGTASFPVGLSAMAAVERARSGGSVEQCAVEAHRAVSRMRNAFVMSALDIVRGDRFLRVNVPDVDVEGIPVVAVYGEDMTVLGDATDVAHASELMAAVVARETEPCRVGIGVGGREAFEFYGELRQRLETLHVVQEIIDYRCGPTVGAFTGPGVAGMAWTVL